MKSSHILAAGAAALLSLASAQADVVIHITGSTAFRGAAIAGINAVLGGSANVKSAYKTGTGITGPGNAGQSVIQGSVAAHPEYGVVTVKCAWSGSSGGIKTVVQNLDTLNAWISVTHLGANGTPVGVASPTYTLDFPGETNQSDVAFSDAKQVTTGFTSSNLIETKVGVIPFEWVVGFQASGPSAISNMTPILAQAVLSGGAPLSQFTGIPGDVTVPVYAIGRDADSGTRISALAETGVGVFGSVQHIQVTTTGGSGVGTEGATINNLYLWPASTLLGVAYPIGNGGYAGGGNVANVLATKGSVTANTANDGGVTFAANQEVLFGPGQLVGYLGRSDARTATKNDVVLGNNAHRLTFNGVGITAAGGGPENTSNGQPAGGYKDNLIQEGLYQCWEYEWFSYRSTYGTTDAFGKAVADLISAHIISTDASVSGLLLSTMNVTKAVEGGVITHL